MTRSTILMIAVALALGGVANHASAAGSKIAVAMGNLRWGMSESDVTAFARRQLEEHYRARIAKAKRAAQKSQLQSELKRAVSEMEHSLTRFNGSHSRWDRSPVAGEFGYGNGESLLAAKDGHAVNYYFFIDGHLWKWYKAFDKSDFGHGDFKKFAHAIEGKFGKGRLKEGEVAPGQGETKFLEYLDRNSRLRAADNSKRGVFALIFDEMATVREIAATRPTKPSRLAGMSDDEDSKPKNQLRPNHSEQTQVARANTRRSVFSHESRGETDQEYQARKQKEQQEARNVQRRIHDRKEEAKKGEVLKQLDGLDDSDPLGGL